MKYFLISVFILSHLTIDLMSQSIERIYPEIGFYSWQKFHFISKETGFAATGDGLVFKTRDEGHTWKEVLSSDAEIFKINIDAKGIGYASNYHNILVTKDFGDHWQELKIPMSEHYVADICQVSNGLVMVLNHKLYITQDLHSFKAVKTPTEISFASFVNPKKGYIGNDTIIYETNNGGVNWSIFKRNPIKENVNKKLIIKDSRLVIIKENSATYFNKGTEIEINGTFEDASLTQKKSYLLSRVIVSIDNQNKVDTIKTNSKGRYQHFAGDNIELSESYEAHFIAIATDSVFYAATYRASPYFYTTKNAGKKWEILNGITPESNSSVLSYKNNVFISNNFGKFFKSVDGGTTFKEKNPIANYHSWSKIRHLQGDTLYSFNDYQCLLSYDLGESWDTAIYASQSKPFKNLFLSNKNSGFYLDEHSIYKVENGFRNIVPKLTTKEPLMDMCFLGNRGIVLERDGKTWVTTDRGDTWKEKVLETECWFRNVVQRDSSLIICTTRSFLLYSSDLGNTFKRITLPDGYSSYYCSFLDKENILIQLQYDKDYRSDVLCLINVVGNFRRVIEVPSGKYRFGVSGIDNNFIVGELGVLLKLQR
jgi:photosystem II stability/assembly factor-like uncharacterized protein